MVGALKVGAVSSDQIASNEIIARHVGSNEIITFTANIKDAIIDNAKIINVEASKITTLEAKIQAAQIGQLNANQITVGANSTYEANYNPSEKEIPAGAQSKANTAETNAKAYANPTKPEGAHLFHFDRSVVSTDGTKPEDGAVYTLRPNEGRFSGALEIREGDNFIIKKDLGTKFTLSEYMKF